VTERPEPVPDGERLIANRYRLGEIIGRGGMATIYRAHDTRTDRVVALKLLRPEISADRDLADRFRREALAATVLRHQNIVACVDTGSDPAGPFLVMDLIEGEDLAARLNRAGPLPATDVARIGLDIARALGVAHVRGIVHRDVKPSNIRSRETAGR
jgi:serine/threonine-protein kinase